MAGDVKFVFASRNGGRFIIEIKNDYGEENASYFSTEVCSAINAKIYLLQETYLQSLLVRLSQTIPLDTIYFYFPLNLIIAIIRCVDVIIVLHQASSL